MECDNAPFSWLQSKSGKGAVPLGDGSFINGFEPIIAKKAAESLNMELKIIKLKRGSLLSALNNGEIDAVISEMPPTDKLANFFTFSNIYYTADLVMVVNSDGKYASASSLKDFGGALITAKTDTTYYSAIGQIPNVNKTEALPDFPSLCFALASNKIDGFVVSRPSGYSAAGIHPGLAVVEFNEGSGFNLGNNELSCSVALKQGSNLLNGVNAALGKISNEERAFLMEAAFKAQPKNTVQ
jgi:ABC-type amino acid transport substrate-binding protein